MTRIVLNLENLPRATYTTFDSRSVRELIKLINTGELIVGLGEIYLGNGRFQQSAVGIPSQNTIQVTMAAPPVQLSRRMYQILHGMADGRTSEQIARVCKIQERTVYRYVQEMKQRFGVATREEMLMRAVELGLL